MYQRIHKSSSWNPSSQEESSQLAPRPFAVQAQQDSRRPPTEQEVEEEAFDQNKFEAFGLQLKKKSGTITPIEQERLGVLQTKIDNFWAQRLEGVSITSTLLKGRTTQTSDNTSGDRPDSSVEQRPNQTGMPDALKAGVESLSGYSLDDVRVHYNSPEPAQIQALAYAQGTEIHLAPGQEEHLPHEAWHVVQQMQGRVQPTAELWGIEINDSHSLEQEAEVMGAQSLTTDFHPASVRQPAALNPDTSVIQGVFTYTASVILDRDSAETKKADSLEVAQINLPEKNRPPTQYGQKQQAHSVSWTLIKKSYEAIKDKQLDQFIDVLKQDWKDLKKQESMGKIEASHNIFTSYLNKYSDRYFDQLKTQEFSFLRWYGMLQKMVTDYFVALQLAPLSTHTGYSEKIGAPSTGVKESQPSGHGEPEANAFFRELEENDGTGKTVDDVVRHARYYWDPGIGMEHGINETNQVELIAEEYAKFFARAYPKTWNTYKEVDDGKGKKKGIQAEVLESAKEAVKAYSGKGHSNPGKISDTDDKIEDDGSGTFQAQIQLKEISGGTASADQFEIKEYEVKEIALPDDRPMTKYGIVGQKSHTVSWTLVLQSLNNLGKGKSLKEFLQALLLKWIGLSKQDWDGMVKANLITSSDFKSRKSKPTASKIEAYNEDNQARLKNLQSKLESNKAKLTEAIAGKELTDQDWAKLVQDSLSEYVLVYQSSPLTAYKAEKTPKGHGEPDANDFLRWIEDDRGGDLDAWSLREKAAKFKSDLYEEPGKPPVKSRWQGKDDNDRNNDEKEVNSALTIAKIIHPIVTAAQKKIKKLQRDLKKLEEQEGSLDEDKKALAALIEVSEQDCEKALEGALSATQIDHMDKILVKQLALKYLDVGWGVAQKGGKLSLDYSSRQLAKVLVDWEEALREAYPQIWARYQSVFEDYSNQFKLPPGLSDSTKTTVQSWVTGERGERESLRGLVSIKSGDKTLETGATLYNQGKQDYDQGRVDAQKNPTGALPNGKPIGFQHGYDDYQKGYLAAASHPPIPLEGGRNLAYKTAYQDYNNGINAARTGQPPANGGEQQGRLDYHFGITAAQTGQPVMNQGAKVGHDDYLQGISDAQSNIAGATTGARQGADDYLQGISDAQSNTVGATTAARQGATEYNQGYHDASSIAFLFGGTRAYRDGFNARRASIAKVDAYNTSFKNTLSVPGAKKKKT